MEKRTLTITLRSDWQAAMRLAARSAESATGYLGETLNFDSPASFFSHLTDKRWMIIYALQGAGTVGVRELSRRLGRDVKRVHEDAGALVDLGLIERTGKGELFCPYAEIHVDMHIRNAA